MKKSVLLIVLVLSPILLSAQPFSVRKTFQKYGHDEGVTKISIPGIAMDFASLFVDDKETAKMIRKVNKIKVLAADRSEGFEGPNISKELLDRFKSNSFEELMTVRSDGENVSILFRENRRKTELLVVAGNDSDHAIVYLKGRITPEMLSKIGQEMNVDPLKKIEI